jgi:hypothetical protein
LDGGSAHRKAATCTPRTAQTQNKRTQTSMPQVGFEAAISMFERAKTVHALDRAATVIASGLIYSYICLLYRDKVVPLEGIFLCENVPGTHQGSCFAFCITAPLAVDSVICITFTRKYHTSLAFLTCNVGIAAR